MNTYTKLTMRAVSLMAVFTMVGGVIPSKVSAVSLPDAAPACAVIIASNTDGDVPTQGGVQTYVHPAWTTVITGAEWLWSDAEVVDTSIVQTETFTQNFIWGGDTISNIDFQFAADNGYTVELNGTEVGSAGVETNSFGAVTHLTVDSSLIEIGENTITFSITNDAASEGTSPHDNPAGFVFKLIIDGTGNACDQIPPVDLCDNMEGNQASIPEGYTADGSACYPVSDEDPVKECVVSGNLLANGSFEDPVVDSEQGWGVFDSVVNGLVWAVSWINPSESAPEIAKLELQNGRPASQGSQYAELDSNYTAPGEAQILGDARVKIAQTVTTIPGVEYTLTYDFSAIPGHGRAVNNKVQVLINGIVVDTQTTSLLPGATTTNWTHQSYTFVASTTDTEVALADAGRSNTFGTLIDNVSLDACVVEDNGGGNDEQLYLIYGTVWDDTDEDDNIDEGEDDLSNWTVKAVNVETDEVITDETDANGRYDLNVPAGTWKISEETESGWELLSDADGDGTYTVTVPAVPVNPEVTLMDWFIPTAMAADIDTAYGPFDFGNNYVGGSSSHHHSSSKKKTDGQVLGDSITKAPEGEVLGASTSTMPVGAPNTGAGGTSSPMFSAFTAILAARTTGRKAK